MVTWGQDLPISVYKLVFLSPPKDSSAIGKLQVCHSYIVTLVSFLNKETILYDKGISIT